MSHKISIVPGILLVLVGVVMLLNKLDLVEWYWEDMYPFILLSLGLLFFYFVIVRNDRNASFWGTTFLLLGVFFSLRNFDVIPYLFWDEIWPVIPLAIGIGFIVLFAFKPQDWGVLIPGAVFLFIGVIALANTMDIYWRTREIIEDFWPVILILVGGALVLSSLARKKQPQE